MKTIEGGRVSKILAAAAVLAGGLWISGVSTAEAQTLAALPKSGTIGRIDASGSARPVKAWLSYCERYAGDCDVNTSEPTTIAFNAKLWRTLNAVNQKVNATIKPTTDQDHWGQPESWDLPTDGRGDCEDFVLEKRRRLALAGFPTGALLVTVVRDRHGDGHAVLTLSTTRGDFVLDNLTDRVKPWEETSYVFDRRQSPTDPNVWLAMRPQAPQTTVAATQKP